MDHYAARTMRDGRYHFTALNEYGGIVPVGHCGYKCLGHLNAEEAKSHYIEYLVDNATYLSQGAGFRPCEVCSIPTNNAVSCGIALSLCLIHATRKNVGSLLKSLWPFDR